MGCECRKSCRTHAGCDMDVMSEVRTAPTCSDDAMENCSKRDKIGLNSVSFRAAGGAEGAAVVVCLQQIAERGGTKERKRGECFSLMVGNIEKRGGAGGGSEQRERWKSFRLLHQNIPTLMQQPAKLQVTPRISDFE